MNKLTRRLGQTAAALLVVAGGTVALSPGASAATSCTGTYSMTCADVSTINSSYDFVTHYTTTFTNNTGSSISGTCTVSTSKTTAKSVTATVGASADFLFAKADASVSGTLQTSVTSQLGTATTFSIPAHSSRTCTYGTSRTKVTGWVKTYACSSSACTLQTSGTWTVIGPKTLTWKVG